MFGESQSQKDVEFDQVFSALANKYQRELQQRRKEIANAKYENPLHKKAVARRRKRKRGGPK